MGRGLRVRALVRDHTKGRSRLGPGANTVLFDFFDPDTYRPAFENAERLLLINAPATVADGERHTCAAIDSAREHGIRRIVYLSIFSTDTMPDMPHSHVERHIRAAGMEYVIVRVNLFMQDFTGMLRDTVINQEHIYLPAADGRVSFIDVHDVAAVISRALTMNLCESGMVLSATGPEALGYAQVADIVSRESGRLVEYDNPSPDEYARTMHSRGVASKAVAFMLALYEAVREGRMAPTTDTVRLFTGRQAIRFEQFARTLSEMRQGYAYAGATNEGDAR